jgi:hypothetical protein
VVELGRIPRRLSAQDTEQFLREHGARKFVNLAGDVMRSLLTQLNRLEKARLSNKATLLGNWKSAISKSYRRNTLAYATPSQCANSRMGASCGRKGRSTAARPRQF